MIYQSTFDVITIKIKSVLNVNYHPHRHHIIHNLILFVSHPKIDKFPLIMSSKLTLAAHTIQLFCEA